MATVRGRRRTRHAEHERAYGLVHGDESGEGGRRTRGAGNGFGIGALVAITDPQRLRELIALAAATGATLIFFHFAHVSLVEQVEELGSRVERLESPVR
jgi:hypothetical protein